MPRLKARSEVLLQDVQLEMPQLRQMMESFNINVDRAGIDTRVRVGSPNLLQECPKNPQNTLNLVSLVEMAKS
jgi:hypothetical protein